MTYREFENNAIGVLMGIIGVCCVLIVIGLGVLFLRMMGNAL